MVKCQANLRSIGQAIAIYTAQHSGYLPPGQDTGNPRYGDAAHAFRWTGLMIHTLNPKYGFTWAESAASGGDSAKTREMLFCPEVPGDRGRLNQTGLSHYVCHPRLMPAVGVNDEPQKDGGGGGGGPFGGGGNSHRPRQYKASKVKRVSEIAIIFEGALQFNSSTGEYQLGYDDPVATNIDNGAYMNGPTYLTDTNYSSTVSPDDSVSMSPTFGPTPGAVNKDGVTNGTDTGGYYNFYNIRFRHKRDTIMNALMVDGHVEAFEFNPKLVMTPSDKKITTLKKKNINVPPM
jgi:prepilin-type processing-associated H-X9-DG protein